MSGEEEGLAPPAPSPVDAALPLVEFDGPETSTFGLWAPEAEAASIRTNRHFMQQRRQKEIEEAMLGEMSQQVYGDPNGWMLKASPDRIAALQAKGMIGPGLERQASVDVLFEAADSLRIRAPGEAANLPLSYDDLQQKALDRANLELGEELAEAENAIANRSDPSLTGGLVSFGAQAWAFGSDVEGLATLPFGAGAGSIGRALLYEGFLGAAGSGLDLASQNRMADALGYERPDPVSEILFGAGVGVFLPLAGRGLRLGVNSLTAKGRAENRDLLRFSSRPGASDLERGAGNALARDVASEETAPEGADPMQHAADMDAAEADLTVRADDVIPDVSEPGARSAAGEGGAPAFDFEPGGNAAPDANLVGYVTGKLIEGGMEPHIALGFVGNFMVESGRGLNTGAIGDGGNAFGMAQWNSRRPELLRFAEARGTDWRDVDTQIAFVFHELGGSESEAWRIIQTAGDAAEAARLVSELYERPGLPHLSSRIAYARMLSDQFGRGEVPKAGAPGKWRDPGDDAMAAGVVSFDPRDIETDAVAYQYKAGGDQYGVTDRLQGEREWDARAAVGVIVHERLDGRRFIADGHQRLGLARRLGDQGQEGISLQGFLMREIDGFSVEDVRAIAALRNIRQESGTPIDAAKIIRDHPELTSQISRGRPFMAQAQALADLAPGPFQAIVNEVIPANWGAIVGRVIPEDDRMQGVAIAALKKADPANETQAESIVRDVRRLGLERAADDAQMDLFSNGFDLRQTVISERAKVIDRVMRDARADRTIFSRLEREADAIQEAGNVLNRSENLSRAEAAEQTLARLLILADQPGPVRDAIDAAARAVRDGVSLDDAARQVTDALGSPVGRGDAAGIAGSGRAPAPIAEALRGVPPRRYVAKLAEQQPFDDIDQLYAKVPPAQARLHSEAGVIAADLGVTWKNPGLKARAATEEKIARKGYASPRSLTDTSRGGFVVAEVAQADQVVARLAAVFDIVDEGWKRLPAGYIDRKVIVRHPDGMLSEVQIWTADMLAAKDLATPIYTQRRSLPDGPEKDALIRRELEIYSAAAAGMKDVRFASDGTSASPMLHPNSRRSTASSGVSDSTPAVWDTSSASTGTQGAPGESWAKAKYPPDFLNRAAGRQSQSQYANSFMGDVPSLDTPNMGNARPSVNDMDPVGDARIQPGLFDDPIEDAAETARLAGLDRDLARRLADPAFDLELPASGPRADGGAPDLFSLRELTQDLNEEGDFVDALKSICDLKGP